jgi:hypothetical protein
MFPLLSSPIPTRGKGVNALHSHMCTLDFAMEPLFDCSDDDAGDVAFATTTRSIRGRDAIEEYVACGLFPLLASFGLGDVLNGET